MNPTQINPGCLIFIGFYELSDGASGSLSNSSNSVFSECLSSCHSSTCFCSPLDGSLNLSDGRPKSAGTVKAGLIIQTPSGAYVLEENIIWGGRGRCGARCGARCLTPSPPSLPHARSEAGARCCCTQRRSVQQGRWAQRYGGGAWWWHGWSHVCGG